jgi:hypothetical protein
MLDIVKAYLQSPRTWNYLATVLPVVLQGNEWGLSTEVILGLITIASGIFGVSMSIRPPRLPDANTDADSTK